MTQFDSLPQHSRGQHIRRKLSVILGDFIVNKHLIANVEKYYLTEQGNSNARHGNIITCGGLWSKVPEPLFEKNGLIPAIQPLLVCHLETRDLLLVTPRGQTSSYQQGADMSAGKP